MSQLRFLQSLARTGIHALDPALDLLNGQSVMTAGLTDLDLEPSSRTEAFDPPIFLQPREAKSRRFVECFRLHVDRVGNARSALEANGTEPEGHRASVSLSLFIRLPGLSNKQRTRVTKPSNVIPIFMQIPGKVGQLYPSGKEFSDWSFILDSQGLSTVASDVNQVGAYQMPWNRRQTRNVQSMTVHPSATAAVSGRAFKTATLLAKSGTAIAATAISAIVVDRSTT